MASIVIADRPDCKIEVIKISHHFRLFLPLAAWVGMIPVSVSSLGAQTPLDLRQADPLGAELFAASSSTGMVMVVVRGKAGSEPETFFHGYGESFPGSGQRPTADAVIRICSLTKIFTTDLLTKLAADRSVQLSDPLQLFAAPHVIVPSRPGHVITLEALGTHTSGLLREVGTAPRDTPHFTFPDYNYRWHWLGAKDPKHLKFAPGTEALYSNVGFDLLGDALSKATHLPYATLLAQRTTGPLAMHETGYTPNTGECARLLRGTHEEGPCTDTQNTAGSSGLYSTSIDMTKWLKYLLGIGTTTQLPAAQAVYLQPSTLHNQTGLDHAGAPTGIGLGWMHVLTGPSEIVGKTGGGAGFTTYIAINHATNTALFVAFTDGPSNNHFNVFKGANSLLLMLSGLPPLPPEPIPPARPAHRHPRRRR
jgi:D-alanyl-D-alanine-carboxypeptidase/D-alanyl-D-alanine-endopeptidase